MDLWRFASGALALDCLRLAGPFGTGDLLFLDSLDTMLARRTRFGLCSSSVLDSSDSAMETRRVRRFVIYISTCNV